MFVAMQDFTEATTIDSPEFQAIDKDIQIGPSGMDRGLCKMAVTVPTRWSTLVSLRNRFEALADLNDTDSSTSTSSKNLANQERIKNRISPDLDTLKFAKASIITSRQVELVSGTRRLSRKREKRLQDPANGHVKDAHTALSKNSLHRKRRSKGTTSQRPTNCKDLDSTSSRRTPTCEGSRTRCTCLVT